MVDEKGDILATTDHSLGLPLLPKIEEYISDDSINQIAADLGYRMLPEDLREGILAGYKAASAKKYTEEDLRKAFEAGQTYEFNLQKYKGELVPIDRYIRSLNPKPIQVEIEIEMEYYHSSNADSSAELVPVIENGYIKVSKWYY